MITICPNCKHTINIISEPRYRILSCRYCGMYTSLVKVRDKCDIKNDKGMYKFYCIGTPWGFVEVINRHRISTMYCVDADIVSIKTFLDSIADDFIISAQLSYLSDGVIKKFDLKSIV